MELSFTAFEDDICLAYTRKNLLRGGAVELACNMINHSENAAIFTRVPALNLLRKALLSLSATYFGSQHRQDHITRKGYRQYGEVLKQLNSTIALQQRQVTDETILTALTCMLLEFFLPTGPTNFLKHQRGIEAMIELRGPPTDGAEPTATIFRGLRVVSILGALADSRPSVYARGDWKRAPIACSTEVGSLQYRIFGVLADCTVLKSERDAMLASGLGVEHYGTFLLRIEETFNDLKSLRPVWEQINNSLLFETEQVSEMARQLGIANQMCATACMLFHAARLCKYS